MACKKQDLNILRRPKEENNFPPCCSLRNFDSCETVEDTFKDIEKFIEINDVFSIKHAPSRTWLISASSRISSEEVITRCKNLFHPHRIIGVKYKGENWNRDGFKYLLYLNHRLNERKINEIFSSQNVLKVEQRGLIQGEEIFYWKRYVTKHYPSLASAAWSDVENEEFQPSMNRFSNKDFKSTEKLVLKEMCTSTSKEIDSKLHGMLSTPSEKLESEELLCHICYVNRFDQAILPCGYTICLQCFDKCETTCPHCRGKILGRIKLHF